jgi:chorismate mutase
MSEELKATIAEQAQEIERLDKDFDDACEDAMSVARQLAALKSNQGAVVLPERRPEVNGTWGDSGDAYNSGVNDTLDEVTRLNASRVQEGCRVTTEGVQFGNAWYSHERITQKSADQLNNGECGLTARQYMEWVRAMLSAAPAPTVEPAHSDVIVTRDWLKHIYRDLDSCQKVIWANMDGCDPSYYEDAQARLAEIDALLAGGEL